MKPRRAAIGIKSKTGRGIAVVLSDSGAIPQFELREELKLYDQTIPATMQPYHEVMELPWTESVTAVKPAIAAIEKIAATALRKLIDGIEARGMRVACVAVVGPKDRQLERIGNPHIRAHAAEGVLFRAVIETAAKLNDCPSRAFADPAAELRQPSRQVKKVLEQFGKAAGPPWRADEKAAAIAAWVALAIPSRPSKR